MAERLRIFCDFWNFQLNWNDRTAAARCDWTLLPKELAAAANSRLRVGGVETDLTLDEMRVYASVNPQSQSDASLAKWLDSFLDRQPGIRVFRRDRSSKLKPAKCANPNCRHEVECCPECNEPYRRAIEKGVDSAIVTDLLSLAWEGAYDVAILLTSDADFIPAVERLQEKGFKIINATWRGHGYHLAKTCWASFELDQLIEKVKRAGTTGA